VIFYEVKNIILLISKIYKLSSLGMGPVGILDNLIFVDKIWCFIYM